jgi:hypothetical protein
MIDGLKQKNRIDLQVFPWEYMAGMPSDSLKSWACSYSGYRENVGRSVCRLEVPKNRVIVILGFGDRLQIHPVGSTVPPVQYQAFVVRLGADPLIV